MDKLIVEPRKLITHFRDMEEIVAAVSARIDEPNLESKTILCSVCSLDNMVNSQKAFREVFFDPESITEEQYQFTDAFYFKSPLTKNYCLFLKENIVDVVFPTYFHELGHIANHEFMDNNQLPQKGLFIVNEAMAYIFEFWAKEELSQISNVQYLSTLFNLHEEKKLQLLPENKHKTSVFREAATNFLLWLYSSQKSNKSSEVYHWLRDYARDEERLKILCQYAETQFLK